MIKIPPQKKDIYQPLIVLGVLQFANFAIEREPSKSRRVLQLFLQLSEPRQQVRGIPSGTDSVGRGGVLGEFMGDYHQVGGESWDEIIWDHVGYHPIHNDGIMMG